MPIKVKSVERTVSKWIRNAGAASGEYLEGIQNADSWATGAAGGEGNYEQGVQAAIARKAYGSGVRKAGDEKWRRGAEIKGQQRYAGGITAGEQSYQEGVAPYLSFMGGLSLGPKGPRGSPENMQRSQNLQSALHKKRVSGVSGT
jgi:hypothetical protein